MLRRSTFRRLRKSGKPAHRTVVVHYREPSFFEMTWWEQVIYVYGAMEVISFLLAFYDQLREKLGDEDYYDSRVKTATKPVTTIQTSPSPSNEDILNRILNPYGIRR